MPDHDPIELDLPHLAEAKPDFRLLHVPAADALWFNPLAFLNLARFSGWPSAEGMAREGRLSWEKPGPCVDD